MKQLIKIAEATIRRRFPFFVLCQIFFVVILLWEVATSSGGFLQDLIRFVISHILYSTFQISLWILSDMSIDDE
jgi:hypothetical protein